ncbi:MAG: plasmid mobilization protein [Solirubrobacteraceae bacterium]
MSAVPGSGPLGRSRRDRQEVPRHASVKVRLSEDERAQLRARAAELGVSVPRLMVESALARWDGQTATERRRELAELFEIRRLLATVANNVNQLARGANISGQVPEHDRLQRTLRDVDEAVGELRAVTGARR